ncbi:hypothetical protein F4820DRAFT_423444 [Hypoxylon rubiginosum]|uniref:Uncharacterized protein n=1 Tax=Hypoxylon rubiginosum TaxID=110542 RepID=A0ACB9YZN7_9PEZI|nr:hypothetical protein F4820DRAFT_423444 [Hypoxylon rubiginosum]
MQEDWHVVVDKVTVAYYSVVLQLFLPSIITPSLLGSCVVRFSHCASDRIVIFRSTLLLIKNHGLYVPMSNGFKKLWRF